MSGTDTGSLASLLRERQDEILRLVREHRGRTISVFGSVARGDAHDDSDIDFLVEFEPASSLLDRIRRDAVPL